MPHRPLPQSGRGAQKIAGTNPFVAPEVLRKASGRPFAMLTVDYINEPKPALRHRRNSVLSEAKDLNRH